MDPHVPITAALGGRGDAAGLPGFDDCQPRPQSPLASLNETASYMDTQAGENTEHF